MPAKKKDIDSKVEANLKDTDYKGINYGNSEASHAKLEEEKNKTYFPPSPKTEIDYKALAREAAEAKNLSQGNKTNPVMLNERLNFNFGSETANYEASLESRIRSKGAAKSDFQDLPSTPAEIFAAEQKAKKEELKKKDNVKTGSNLDPKEQ